MNILISENIKRLRKEKNITQEELAEAMNVSCAAVSKWERGESYPDITFLPQLAFFFDVTLDELVGYDKEKVNAEIEEVLALYKRYQTTERNFEKAKEIIVKAYKDYPNDYNIMHAYMWNIAGDLADNDAKVLLSHKEEFLSVCRKTLDGCLDEGLRLSALNMRAKLYHAEGKTQEALAIYTSKFSPWWVTSEQKSEQLFAKDTPEFLYWVKKNMYELAAFAADKLAKSVFFDAQYPYAEKVKRLELYGDKAASLYEETGEIFFALTAFSLMSRTANDLCFRGGESADIIRIKEKAAALKLVIDKARSENHALCDAVI